VFQVSFALTGYDHNAVTPFDMPRDVPVIVSKALTDLSPPSVWLGGGEVDLKLRLPVDELVEALNATVVDCSVPREVDDEELFC
jgi:prolyl-tRNA editing enzyme YbaK/EbsC (Cys-tRNA(Pro) deacylase)